MPNETQIEKLTRENQDLKDILNLLGIQLVRESKTGKVIYILAQMGPLVDSAMGEMLVRLIEEYSKEENVAIRRFI